MTPTTDEDGAMEITDEKREELLTLCALDELAVRAIRRPGGKPGAMERFVMSLMGRSP